MQGADLRYAGMFRTVVLAADFMNADGRGLQTMDPFATDNPAVRAANATAEVRVWLDTVPKGSRRAAEKRLTPLRDDIPREGDYRPGEEKDPWQDALHAPTLDWTAQAEQDLGSILGELSCEPQDAPHIARRLLRRMGANIIHYGFRSHQPRFAAALLAPDCAGAKGLNGDERTVLQAIADGNQ